MSRSLNVTFATQKNNRVAFIHVCEEDEDNSHDEDGGGDERRRVETPLAVGVLPLPLVHLPSAVLTASAHTEAHADDGCEDHKQDADGGTYEEPGLVVGPLRGDKTLQALNHRPPN